MLSPEQIELRRTRIGASEVGAILGLDPYKTAHDVFLSKIFPDAAEEKDHQRWGLDVEDPIIRFTARRAKYDLIQPPPDADGKPRDRWPSFAHTTWPLVATPDALALCEEGEVAIQAKNDARHGQLTWGEPGTDDAPLLFVAQCTVEIGVMIANGHGVIRDDLAVSLGGEPPVVYPIKFDAGLFGEISEVCAKWKRDHLDVGRPPDGTPSETAEYVKRRWAKHGEALLQPTPELVAMWQEVAKLRADAKALKATVTAAENKLKAAIGEAAGVIGVCTWKFQKGSTYQVTKEPSRVLRGVGAKEE